MTLLTLAEELLARLDIELAFDDPGILKCDDAAAVAGDDLASGPTGAALSFWELWRRTKDPRWKRRACTLLSASSELRPSGLGIFSGQSGTVVAAAALGDDDVPLDAERRDASLDGDLMDGSPGVVWAHLAMGRPIRPAPLPPTSARDKRGLAHGSLGSVGAASVGSSSESLLTFIADSSPDLPFAGWCNGLAGTAVAAALASACSGEARFAELAAHAATSALRALPLETDGLCHGSLGVAACAASVGRCVHNYELVSDAVTAALHFGAALARRPMRLDSGMFVDQSWLTGWAGVAWGLLTCEQRPSVNPLLPLDSVLAARSSTE